MPGSAATRPTSSTSNGGSDTVNAAAVTSASTIRLDGGAGSIGGVAVSFAGIEHAIGGDGDDRLFGDAGDNWLHGMRGRDQLLGGLGTDRLCGGSGFDRFRFGDALSAHGDMILPANGIAFDNPGAARGDRIGLRRIDADATVAGNQAFRFDDSEAAGTLRCLDDGAVTRILGFIDGVAGGGPRDPRPRPQRHRGELHRARLRALTGRPEMERRPRGAPGRSS